MKLNLVLFLFFLWCNQSFAQQIWYHFSNGIIPLKQAYRKATYKYTGVEQANKLSIKDDLSKEAFLFNGGTYTVLLPIHGGVLNSDPSGESIAVDSFYIDATEVCNLHYRNFVSWCQRIYSSTPHVYNRILPDTTVWLDIYPNQAIAEQLSKDYFRDSAFDYYPVPNIVKEK